MLLTKIFLLIFLTLVVGHSESVFLEKREGKRTAGSEVAKVLSQSQPTTGTGALVSYLQRLKESVANEAPETPLLTESEWVSLYRKVYPQVDRARKLKRLGVSKLAEKTRLQTAAAVDKIIGGIELAQLELTKSLPEQVGLIRNILGKGITAKVRIPTKGKLSEKTNAAISYIGGTKGEENTIEVSSSRNVLDSIEVDDLSTKEVLQTLSSLLEKLLENKRGTKYGSVDDYVNEPVTDWEADDSDDLCTEESDSDEEEDGCDTSRCYQLTGLNANYSGQRSTNLTWRFVNNYTNMSALVSQEETSTGAKVALSCLLVLASLASIFM